MRVSRIECIFLDLALITRHAAVQSLADLARSHQLRRSRDLVLATRRSHVREAVTAIRHAAEAKHQSATVEAQATHPKSPRESPDHGESTTNSLSDSLQRLTTQSYHLQRSLPLGRQKRKVTLALTFSLTSKSFT